MAADTVVMNVFIQIVPSANHGQIHNEMTLSMYSPDHVIFNQVQFDCKWNCTIDCDGQWRALSISWAHAPSERYGRPIEFYVRISREMFILQSRHYERSDNSFPKFEGKHYNVPLYLLRVKSSTSILRIPDPEGVDVSVHPMFAEHPHCLVNVLDHGSAQIYWRNAYNELHQEHVVQQPISLTNGDEDHELVDEEFVLVSH